MSRTGRRRAWSLALLLVSVNAACGGYRPVPDFNPGDLQQAATLDGAPVSRLWRSRPVRGPSAPMALDQQNVYLGGSDRRIVAVDLGSGRTRWAVRVAGPLVGGTLVDDTLVYAATDRPDGKVYALKTISGSKAWSTGTGFIQAPLLLVDGRLIALGRTGVIVALSATTGKIAWRRPLPPTRVPPVALGNGLIGVSTYDSLYGVRLADGKVVIRLRSPGTVVSPWVRVGTSLIATTADSLVVAVSSDSLRLQWQLRLDAPLLASPAVRGDTLWCVTRTGSIHRILPGGTRVATELHPAGWAATGAPAVIGPWLLVGSSDGALHAFELTDGAEAWHALLGRPFELAPIPLPDGSFLALGGRGDLHRIRP